MLEPISYNDCLNFFSDIYENDIITINDIEWRFINRKQEQKSVIDGNFFAFENVIKIKDNNTCYKRLFALIIYQDSPSQILIDKENYLVTQGNCAFCFKELVEAQRLKDFQQTL